LNLFSKKKSCDLLVNTNGKVVEKYRLPQVKWSWHSILISEGKSASTGTAAGRAFIAGAGIPGQIPDDAILVTRVASPEYTAVMGKIREILTDVGIWAKAGSVTSFDALTIEAGGNTRIYNAEPAK
jgi:hypothetical protein